MCSAKFVRKEKQSILGATKERFSSFSRHVSALFHLSFLSTPLSIQPCSNSFVGSVNLSVVQSVVRISCCCKCTWLPWEARQQPHTTRSRETRIQRHGCLLTWLPSRVESLEVGRMSDMRSQSRIALSTWNGSAR